MPLLIDKPTGITSHDVVNKVRRATGERRVGHAGTLDPLASGLLIVLVGRAETKQQSKYLTLDKTYQVAITLGAVSATDDAEGPITPRAAADRLTTTEIEVVLKQFVGQIQQRPPTHSAIHINGERAYRLARRQELELADVPLRTVTIDQLILTAWQPPILTLQVDCGHGTYIRSLARDIGEQLGVGGYVLALRRTRIGSFHIADAMPYAQVNTLQKMALPPK